MQPRTYRKKPVVIQALQLTPASLRFIHQWIIDSGSNGWYDATFDCYEIELEDGFAQAQMGDFIIKGVGGEFYTCKPNIFLETYESAAWEAPT